MLGVGIGKMPDFTLFFFGSIFTIVLALEKSSDWFICITKLFGSSFNIVLALENSSDRYLLLC